MTGIIHFFFISKTPFMEAQKGTCYYYNKLAIITQQIFKYLQRGNRPAFPTRPVFSPLLTVVREKGYKAPSRPSAPFLLNEIE